MARRHSDEVVYRILTESCSDGEMAKRIGIKKQVVWQIRRGRTYSDLFPEIKRREKRGTNTCLKCKYRRNATTEENPNPCSFYFPEPVKLGVYYANECNLFDLATDS